MEVVSWRSATPATSAAASASSEAATAPVSIRRLPLETTASALLTSRRLDDSRASPSVGDPFAIDRNRDVDAIAEGDARRASADHETRSLGRCSDEYAPPYP
jgi:hypothetical protein